jgi:U3 small nucleolar RNA-associated protein 15
LAFIQGGSQPRLFLTDSQAPIIIKESGSVLHTHFSPSSPHSLAISSSARVQIYNPNSRQLIKTLSRFKDTVQCAEFRSDGKLLLASDKTGTIQLFDLSSRAILQHWNPEDTHSRLQVSKVKWQGFTNVVSAGDDKTVKLWDITAKSSVQTFVGHEDYVRALACVPETNLILSGSFDGSARLWDPRVQGEVATFRHGDGEGSGIVYSVLPLKGATMFLSAGSSGVKVWDMTAGTKYPVKQMWNHQKEVTALCGNTDGSRVLAGGLDGLVKIYDAATWKVVHGVKYPDGILNVLLSVFRIRDWQLLTWVA